MMPNIPKGGVERQWSRRLPGLAAGGATPDNGERIGRNEVGIEIGRAMQMGEWLVELLVCGMEYLHKATRRYWKRNAPPVETIQDETYTDQWQEG